MVPRVKNFFINILLQNFCMDLINGFYFNLQLSVLISLKN